MQTRYTIPAILKSTPLNSGSQGSWFKSHWCCWTREWLIKLFNVWHKINRFWFHSKFDHLHCYAVNARVSCAGSLVFLMVLAHSFVKVPVPRAGDKERTTFYIFEFKFWSAKSDIALQTSLSPLHIHCIRKYSCLFVCLFHHYPPVTRKQRLRYILDKSAPA